MAKVQEALLEAKNLTDTYISTGLFSLVSGLFILSLLQPSALHPPERSQRRKKKRIVVRESGVTKKS